MASKYRIDIDLRYVEVMKVSAKNEARAKKKAWRKFIKRRVKRRYFNLFVKQKYSL